MEVKNKIKAIVFDVGGVISYEKKSKVSKLGKLAEKYKVNPIKFQNLRAKYSKQALIGRISAKEFQSIIVKRLKIKNKKKFVGEWERIFKNKFKVDKKVNKIINKLSKNYTLATLTNITQMLDEVRIKHKVYKHFKYNITSYEYKTKKPLIKIYKILIKKLKISPHKIVYTDNHERNLLPAKKLGMKTILFKNSKQLCSDLKKLSIKLT